MTFIPVFKHTEMKMVELGKSMGKNLKTKLKKL
jgi:hypothetical protein